MCQRLPITSSGELFKIHTRKEGQTAWRERKRPGQQGVFSTAHSKDHLEAVEKGHVERRSPACVREHCGRQLVGISCHHHTLGTAELPQANSQPQILQKPKSRTGTDASRSQITRPLKESGATCGQPDHCRPPPQV